MFRHVLVLGALAMFISLGAAEEPADPSRKAFERWVEYYQEVAGGYDIRLKSQPDEPLEVSAEPVHVYTNPSSGLDTHGAFFVWTHNGRAEAIGAIWSKLTGRGSRIRYVHHEFQSLSTEPFVAKGREGLTWAPRAEGVELKEVADAPPPAKTKALRLAQMRAIARGFTGYHVNPTEFQLRLLAQPLYRYEPPEDADALGDGAVFGLFMDWDPEILLVLEIRPTDAGPRWHYAVGRFSNKPLRLEHGGRDVWEHAGGDFGDPRGPFYAKHGVATRPAELE